MRTIGNSLLLTGALLLGVAGSARAGDTAIVKANVPFQFVVHGQSFQPGKYTIEKDDFSPSVLLIRAHQGKHTARFVTTISDTDKDPGGSHAVLKFKPPAGLFPITSYEQESTTLVAGNRVILVTDGIIERMPGDPERAAACVGTRVSAAELCRRVFDWSQAPGASPPVAGWDDDRTALVLAVDSCSESEIR